MKDVKAWMRCGDVRGRWVNKNRLERCYNHEELWRYI